MNSECLRIADQLRRAFNGEAWHGPSLRELLDGVTETQATRRPLPAAHNIRELVLHIEIYLHIANEATQGIPMPKLFVTKEDWFEPTDECQADIARMFASAERFAVSIEDFGDARLHDIAPGREYNFYYLFHGVIQHSLYHAGQIALLKTAQR